MPTTALLSFSGVHFWTFVLMHNIDEMISSGVNLAILSF